MTEITDIKQGEARGVLFYDATCRFCTAWIARIRGIVERRMIVVKPFADGAAESEMRLRWWDGREFGGADALVFLTRQIWWATPLWWLSGVPGVKKLLRAGYAWVASNRRCLGGACRLPAFESHENQGLRVPEAE